MNKLMIQRRDMAFTDNVILASLRQYGNQTVNEIIAKHHNDCIDEINEKLNKSEIISLLKSGVHHKQTHMNKRPTVLERKGVIFEVDKKKGPSGKKEKVWGLQERMNYVSV